MQKINSTIKRHVSNASNINVVNNDFHRIIFNVLLWSFGALVLLYVFLLGNMVKNIVERKSLESDVRALSSEVGNLELAYLAASSSIDLPFSYSLGFKETKATFANRKSDKTLGYGNDNIKVVQNEI